MMRIVFLFFDGIYRMPYWLRWCYCLFWSMQGACLLIGALLILARVALGTMNLGGIVAAVWVSPAVILTFFDMLADVFHVGRKWKQ